MNSHDSVAEITGMPVSELDTPALLVDLDILQRNVERMADTIIGNAGVGWRPHIKAMRTPALAQLCLAAGAHGVTCATLAEANMMAAGGVNDILIANQIVDEEKIDRLAQLCLTADIAVCVDDKEVAGRIDASAASVCELNWIPTVPAPQSPTLSAANRNLWRRHVRQRRLHRLTRNDQCPLKSPNRLPPS